MPTVQASSIALPSPRLIMGGFSQAVNIVGSSTNYFPPMGLWQIGTTLAEASARSIVPGELLSNFRLIMTAGSACNCTATVMVNGMPSALTVTYTTVGAAVSDLTNTVAVSANDVVSVRIVENAGSAENQDVKWCLELS